jgi:hypothetical protein
VLTHAILCPEILMNDARPLTRRAYLIVLPVFCVLMTACSGAASSTPPAAKASSAPPAAAAGPSATTAAPANAPTVAVTSPGVPLTPPSCYDSCGQTEPVLFYVPDATSAYAYEGIRPTTIDLSVESNSEYNVAEDLTWSSWPSAANGDVGASVTATATGRIKSTGKTVTITLSDPIVGDPTIWGTITEQVQGQQQAVYQENGLFAVTASGGQTF